MWIKFNCDNMKINLTFYIFFDINNMSAMLSCDNMKKKIFK